MCMMLKSLLKKNLSLLRYRDFRHPPGHHRQYEYNAHYWHVMAARMAFIIVVEVGLTHTRMTNKQEISLTLKYVVFNH